MEYSVKKIVILLLFSLSLLHAEEPLDLNTTEMDQNGFFVRGGFGFSNGTAKIRQTENDNANSIVTLSTEAMVANSLEFVLGYEKYDQGVRFCFNAKLSYENVGVYEIKSTRYMGGLEGFRPLSAMNLNYGVMIGGGKAEFSTADNRVNPNDLTSFLGLEAYVGADGKIRGNFGYFVKLGYEIKGYDGVHVEDTSTLPATSYRDDFVVYNINAGAGVSYRF